DLSGMTTNIGSNIRWKGLHSLFDAYLDELVKNLVTAGTSRNKVLNQLIEIGIEEAMKALPPDVAADIRGHAG
ncbi:hypothetical protein, partial [Aeromonas caviae]|uniref:hypothetical protein n=1 Tax=Aeromonas caviae TaxID=648 RepID=UPI001CC63363